jgi:hypothetical protein
LLHDAPLQRLKKQGKSPCPTNYQAVDVGQCHTFLTYAPDGSEWLASHPGCFNPKAINLVYTGWSPDETGYLKKRKRRKKKKRKTVLPQLGIELKLPGNTPCSLVITQN